MADSIPAHIIEHIASAHSLDGLNVVNIVQGQRHEVIKLVGHDGKRYALRRFMPKETDISYFDTNFCMKRECSALQSLNANNVPAPSLFAHAKHDDIGDYALLSWLDGDHLNAHFKAACETEDARAMTQMVRKIAHLFARVHSSPIPQDLDFSKSTRETDSLSFYIEAIRAHASREDFRSVYTGRVEPLVACADTLRANITKPPQPALILYDLHGENMIVQGEDIYVFDVDYAHIGVTTAEFIPLFHDLIARFLPPGHRLKQTLRDEAIKAYENHGGIFHADCELVLALNHFMVSMIKLLYRKEAEAKSKIPIYDRAIRMIVEHQQLEYPQVGWSGDPVYGSAQLTKKQA